MQTSGLASDPTMSPEELRMRLDGLTRLLEITRMLAAEIDLKRVLETITDEARSALSCERASLFQYDPKLNELFTTTVTELEINEIRVSVERGITGHVARTRQTTVIPDPPADPRWNSSVDKATGYTTRNILATPLCSPHDQRLLGVLQFLNKIDGSFDVFDEQLAEAFSQHAAVALDRARIIEELQKQHVIDISLNVARDIQRAFMPSDLPQIEGYEMATWWFPNQAIGGDYCDVIPLKDGRTGLVIADVSGHGLGPSLLMASVRAALRALVMEYSSADVMLNLLARSMEMDFQNGHFITMVIACLDSAKHLIEFANAGHAPAMHYDRATQQFTDMGATGLPLGILDRPEYPQGSPINLAPGDIVLLCTDGIVESMDENDEQFGDDRLEGIIREMHDAPIKELVTEIGRRVQDFYPEETPPDDLTILAIRRNG